VSGTGPVVPVQADTRQASTTAIAT